jgi:uncharacterized protein YabN with tetrapyrrole methylase and pyrophosphatase domain
VFAAVEVRDAADVLRNWDQIKRDERGTAASLFGDLPGNLPALLYARKVQRRAAAGGETSAVDPAVAGAATGGEKTGAAPAVAGAATGGEKTGAAPAVAELRSRVAALEDSASKEDSFERVGELLFAAVAAARALGVDPELALRQATLRFETRVTAASAAATPIPEGDDTIR